MIKFTYYRRPGSLGCFWRNTDVIDKLELKEAKQDLPCSEHSISVSLFAYLLINI